MKVSKVFKFTVVKAAILTALAFSVFSCKTTEKSKAPLVVQEEDARMFWSISSTDANGNPSRVYLLGTVHVGDGRLYPLEEPVLEAISSADRMVAELSMEDLGQAEQIIGAAIEDSKNLAEGKNLFDYLSDEEKAVYSELIPEEYDLSAYEPWVSTYILQNIIFASSGYNPTYGLDTQLYLLAIQNGAAVEGLDTIETQLEALSFGDYDTQLAILKDTLREGSDGSSQELTELYEAYLSGDKDAMTEHLTKADEGYTDQDWYPEYCDTLLYSRNRSWAEQISAYLEQGGTTFIFAGCAHFLGENSVFDYLK